MKRTLVIAGLIFLIASSAWAPFRELRVNYYYDETYATWIGAHYVYCNGDTYDFGSLGSWRIWDEYSCWSGARVVHKCQQSNGAGGWVDMVCPF